MHYDIDDIDYQNVTYMGMEIDGYKGFSKLSLGQDDELGG